MSELPYIPPQSPGDPPSSELTILFLEAVARVTPAFAELREILPEWNRPSVPVDRIEEWHRRWFSRIENYELRDKIYAWAYQVLDWWKRDGAARDALRVDCGWWHSNIPVSGRPSVPARIAHWNPHVEAYEEYKTRILRSIGGWLDAERDKYVEQYSLRAVERRDRGRPARLSFEWLALSICKGMSDGQIAQRSLLSKTGP